MSVGSVSSSSGNNSKSNSSGSRTETKSSDEQQSAASAQGTEKSGTTRQAQSSADTPASRNEDDVTELSSEARAESPQQPSIVDSVRAAYSGPGDEQLASLESVHGNLTDPYAETLGAVPEGTNLYADLTPQEFWQQGARGTGEFVGELARIVGDAGADFIGDRADRLGDRGESILTDAGQAVGQRLTELGREQLAAQVEEGGRIAGAGFHRGADFVGEHGGQLVDGASHALGGTAEGFGELAAHPVTGGLAIAEAVANPVETINGIAEEYRDRVETEGVSFALGHAVGDLVSGAGAGRAAGLAGDAARARRALPEEGLEGSARLSEEFLQRHPEAAAARRTTDGLFADFQETLDTLQRGSPERDIAIEDFLADNADSLMTTARTFDEALEREGSPFIGADEVAGRPLSQSREGILGQILDGQFEGPNGLIEITPSRAHALTRGLLLDSDVGSPASLVELQPGTRLSQASASGATFVGGYFSPQQAARLGPHVQQGVTALPRHSDARFGRFFSAGSEGAVALQSRVAPRRGDSFFVDHAFGGGQQFQLADPSSVAQIGSSFVPGSFRGQLGSFTPLEQLGFASGSAVGVTTPFLDEILAQQQGELSE